MVEQVFSNCRIATMAGESPYGLIENAAMVVANGRVSWVGSEADLPVDKKALPVDNLDGRLVTPGLIDCHTHLVYGGNRAMEFEMRLNGAGYEEIARAGGGIVSTMRDTRTASEEELVEQALPRLDSMISEGVITIEIKSGYGLSIEHEIKMLRVARRLAALRNINVITSWLAAHALPQEYADRSDAYIEEVAVAGLITAHEEGLVDAVDGFCEGIAFSPEQIARVFEAAKSLGLPVKLHAEQLSDLGGAKLAASFGALSADHLEYLDSSGVQAVAESGTVAVLLPGAFYTLRETKLPPVAALRAAGVPIAIATDANPGSSPLFSPLLTMNMACTLFRLTPEEALAGFTKNAARALGLSHHSGTLEAGKSADLAIWDVEHPAELSYRIGFNPLFKTVKGVRP